MRRIDEDKEASFREIARTHQRTFVYIIIIIIIIDFKAIRSTFFELNSWHLLVKVALLFVEIRPVKSQNSSMHD